MKLRHFFLPHPETHKRAHLISAKAFFVYVILFGLLQLSFAGISHVKPGVLGITSDIEQPDLIMLTNQERAQNGLPPLKENHELDVAAAAKAQNMFQENYWAHFAPSGKSPWDFIRAAGYSFTYAGENLARNFTNSQDVVTAWMNSPSHRENIVNPHYTDIGMAVVDGTLLGQKTTLVVQEFGTPVKAMAENPTPVQSSPPQVTPAAPSVLANAPQNLPQTLGVPTTVPSTSRVLVDPFALTKDFGITLLAVILALLVVDFVVIKRRGVYRLAFRHLPHLVLLVIALVTLIGMHSGGII